MGYEYSQAQAQERVALKRLIRANLDRLNSQVHEDEKKFKVLKTEDLREINMALTRAATHTHNAISRVRTDETYD